jgi:hypothetical protein
LFGDFDSVQEQHLLQKTYFCTANAFKTKLSTIGKICTFARTTFTFSSLHFIMDSNSRKRLRRSKEGEDAEIQEQQQHGTVSDDRLFETTFPKHLEAKFATAIFEIGLKHSSPKILMVIVTV